MPQSAETYVVTLSRWRSERGITGERWTLEYAGAAVQTFATELQARRFAKAMGWRVVVEGQE